MDTISNQSNSHHVAPCFGVGVMVSQQLTMSSREIAALTGKEHFHVKRDIEVMLAALKKDASSFGCIYLDAMNREQREYLLDEEHTLCLTSGYDVNQRMAIIQQWKAKAAPASHLDTARMLVASLEAQAEQAAKLAIAAPKAAFVDSYVEAAGSMSFRQVAKLLNANERQFRQMLLDTNTMYYLGGVLTPRADHQHAGRFEVKTGTSDHNGHAFSQARFTAKGVEWVAGKWTAYSLRGDQ